MKKKVVSIMMTAALAVGMLAGCGNSDSGSSNAASGNDSKSTSEAGSTSASASNAAEEEGNYHNPYRMVSIRGSGKRQR